MFEKKVDVDKHVEYVSKRTQSETELNLRGLSFAKLYFKVGEYEVARRYVSNYLIAKPKSAEAQLFLGNVLEKLARPEAALEAYRTSLDIDPKQKGLILKVCELLATNDVEMDSSRARYWCEQAQLLDPNNPAVFNLRERLVSTENNNPDEIRKLFLSELEHRPTDVGLRIRLLHHMLQNNHINEAYKHVADIEQRNLSIFANHLAWYEIVSKILIRYRNENSNNNTLTSEFWMLIVSVLDRFVALCLDENLATIKNLSECVSAVFNLDQMLTIAAEHVANKCPKKQFSQEFLIHYRAQVCYHIVTLVFKQAKKDQIKYKEAVSLVLPLLLICYHSQPIELQCVWLEHTTEPIRRQVQRWHRFAAFRCSQAGHILNSLVRERSSSFADRIGQLCAGSWREKIYKNIFITRDQQMKMKTSYFVTCLQFDDVTIRLPESTELHRYDEVAQLINPDSLHHMIWIGLNYSKLVKFRCTVFDGLQYSIRNLSNCAGETLNILDIQAFLYCCIFCAQSNIEESKHMIYFNQEKPNVLPALITEPYGSLNQTKWFSSVYKIFRNECGSNLSDVRVTLIKGIEVVRCAGAHGLDVKLLVMLANLFSQKAKQLTKQSEIEFTEARAELYWRTALPLLEKLRNNQAISYPAKRWFEYRGKDITPTEINMNLEEGKLFLAVQLIKKKDHEKALQMLENLKSPYASFYQAQTYKLLADEQMSHNKENVTSEMRSQHIILLSKARDCFYLTLDRLREPSVDRKHPLNAELGTEIEKIERLLSRIDPDTCMNRNECDGMSDENLSSVGSVGEHVNMSSVYTLHSSYHNGAGTPRHEHQHIPTTPYRTLDFTGLNQSRRAEARPSPERLDAQLRQMAAAKDAAATQILDENRMFMDMHKSLVEEIRSLKEAVSTLTSSVDNLGDLKKNLDELKVAVDEQVPEIKKDLAELKKDTTKLKNNEINEEDLYALEEEYSVDYNINAGASNFNSALYSNFPAAAAAQRLQGANTLAYGAPGLYSMYPMYPYGGLGLGQPGALPFPEGHVPDFRSIGLIAQGLSHTGLAGQNQQQQLPSMFTKLPTDGNAYNKFDNSNLSLNTTPLLAQPVSTPSALLPTTIASGHLIPQPMPITSQPVVFQTPSTSKAPPVNVVITASDPLPTTSVTQPILSVTIPPQHLKGNQPLLKLQPHNFQIPLPTTTQTFSNVPSSMTASPMPVSTQNLLSNVAPPVYSSLTVKSPNQSNKSLGLQIEKLLAQSFSSNTSLNLTEPPKKSDLDKSNAPENSFIMDEHDPCPDFKPIIPLPDEVPLTTGEENERVLFCEHAKLFRFVDKEWRDRGIGNIKILQNESTGKVRVLMRRDQVHKICANYFLTSDIILTPMQKNDRAYIWAANDFADENIVLEKFCVRFKTVEEGKKFASAFEYAKNLLIQQKKQPISCAVTQSKTPTATNTANTSNQLLGGFVFTSTPTFKPKTDLITDAASEKQPATSTLKDSPFASFSFGSITPKADIPKTDKATTDFKPVQKPTETPTLTPKPDTKQTTTTLVDSSQQDDDGDFTPTAEFKPVIPLPDLVEIKTGEENCEVLCEVKAKLLRFESATKEWKECGIGIMKILKDNKTIRLLMRREQVHKICCNHQLLKSMVFTNMPKNDRVLNWCAQDFADNVLKTEMFAIRFRSAEICEEFLATIHRAQEMLNSSNNVISSGTPLRTSSTAQSSHSGWGDKFKPKEGSWECSSCYVSNNAAQTTCLACTARRNDDDSSSKTDSGQSPQRFKPSPVTPPVPTWTDKGKPKVGTWLCKVCYIHNDGKHHYCEACDSPKNDSVPKKDANVDPNASGQQFSFGVPTQQQPPVQPASAPTSGWGDRFKPKVGSWECEACYVNNNADTLYCIACESPKDNTVPKKESKGIDFGSNTGQTFSFGIPATGTSAAVAAAASTTKPTESIFGAKAQTVAGGFTFGMPQITTPVTTGFTFGMSKVTEATTTTATTTITTSETIPLNLAQKTTFTFSLNKPADDSTVLTTTSTTLNKDEFIFGSPNKHEFEFKPRSPRKISSGDGDAESDASGVEEECDNIYFKPVVPLPDKVDVKTGEEDEEALYCHRAKLFRFCTGEWKEQGTGDVKILKNNQTGKLKVVMRREQVLKICLNHVLTNDIDYKVKDDRTWLFSAADYSDGEIAYQQFCLRFKSAEVAQEFMKAITDAQSNTSTNTTSASAVSDKKSEKQDNSDDVSPNTSLNLTEPPKKSDLDKSNAPENSFIMDEHDPCPDFKPIIPLPDEVPLTTGEENERVLFCEHAKLFRFVDKEWRDRGIGNIKILQNESTGKVRVLMRRDQVHKICANYFLTSDLILTPMQKNERAYIWAANDFADENIVLEKFCVRFKTVEEGKKFASAFEYAKNLLIQQKKQPISCAVTQSKTPTATNTANTSNQLLGGFVFTSTPTFKPKTDLITDAASEKQPATSTLKDSPFASFSFGSITPKADIPKTDKATTDFKPVQKPTETPTLTPKPDTKQTTTTLVDSSQQDDDGDFTPTAEFKPVIPLPDLVEIKTGEENCEVLCEVKAKLLRFESATKEWKECGIGIMKILKDNKTIRLLMRREQVHKICCNHQLLKSMVFTNMPKNDRVLNWCAQDFADNVLKTEMFAIRFRSAEICEEFLATIHRAQEMLNSSNNVISSGTPLRTSSTAQSSHSGWGDKFKPKEGSWECSSCYVSNNAAQTTCLACTARRNDDDSSSKTDSGQSPQRFKPSPVTPPVPTWTDKGKPKVGTWLCKVCYIHNDGKHHYCEACDSPKNDSVPKKDANVDPNASGQQFSFGVPTQQQPPVQPASAPTSGWGDRFKPKVGSWECEACYVNNNADTLYCIACESPKDNTVPKKESKGIDFGSNTGQTFSFGIPATGTSAAVAAAASTTKPTESIFGAKAQTVAGGFTFGMPQITTPVTTGFTFGMSKVTEATTTTATTTITTSETIPLNLAQKTTFTFSLNKPADDSTVLTTTSTTLNKDEFIFGSPNKHEFEFKPRSPRKISSGDGDAESDASGVEEECDNIYFKPVVPLPDKVDVKTGEEDEEALYCHRAKLFRFCTGEWKEQGTGDVKILKNNQTGKLKVVMRREQVLKICLNHVLTNDIDYKVKDDRTWLFSAADYSDGEIAYQQFCLRFKSAEVAQEFMKAITDAQSNTSTNTTSASAVSDKKSEKQDNSDDDVEIVYELKVSPSEEAKALALKLPKNFYAYLQKPMCKGCIGCNDDNFVFDTSKPAEKPKIEFNFGSVTKSLSTPSQSIFGSSTTNPFLTPTNTSIFNTTTNTSVFETPKSQPLLPSTSSIFSGSATNKSLFETPKAASSNSFTFTSSSQPKALPTFGTNNTHVFSTSVQSPNIFGGGSMVFGKPTKTDSSTVSTPLQSPAVVTTQAEHKSPLAPSKLAAVVATTSNIFATTTPSINSNMFGTSNLFTTTSTASECQTAAQVSLTKLLSSNKTTTTTTPQSGSIFSGMGTSTIFGNTTQNTSIFSGAPTLQPIKSEGTIFGGQPTTTSTTLFGGTGDNKMSQPIFGNMFGQQTTNEIPSIFGGAATTVPSFSSLAQTKIESEQPILNCDSNLSFASLASAQQETPFASNMRKEQADSKSFTFAGAGSLVFGNSKAKPTMSAASSTTPSRLSTAVKDDVKDADDTEGDVSGAAAGEGEEYDPHYEPIIPLTDAIVVKTGEEDETAMFNERAKLYRYSADTKEWKERGVGQMKLLHHPTNDTYRLLLRLEQVHKLVLNQLVTTNLDLQPMQSSDRAWLWAGYNYSVDGGQFEKLAVRFKNPELAKQFHDAMVAAIDYLNTKPAASGVENVSGDSTSQYADDDVDQDDYGSEESDENRSIMFSNRCTLSYKTEFGNWEELGTGTIKMYYDSEIFAGRIEMYDDNGEVLSNTIVAVNTIMKMEGNCCIWRSMEWKLNPKVPRILKAEFSSVAEAQEMYYSYEESKQYAQHSDIVDTLPEERS